MTWLVTDKGDQDARRLADRHYSRQTPGSPQFCRNGQNIVLLTPAANAAWVTFRPTPGVAKRADGLDAWECALFRNEGGGLSSDLIREAVGLSVALWGPFPPDGFITYVEPKKIRSANPGCCFKHAGWERWGESADGKPRFRAPAFDGPLPAVAFRGDRGGVTRQRFEAAGRVA